jgi:protein-S-isoprenylcysteine O-methyltransferase Ste14
MTRTIRNEILVKLALLSIVWFAWWWASEAQLSHAANLFVIVGGVLPTFPLIWIAGKMLDRNQTKSRAVWTTIFVHFALGFFFGVPIIRAIITYRDWAGWAIPVPAALGLSLVVVSGAAFFLVVANLALRGLGAPFFIALSRKLAVDWLYAWTRNPMALAGMAFLTSLGIWFQSAMFVLWATCLFAPALLFFIKVYEERELEIRFGTSYLDYKSRTSMLIPRKPNK